MNTKKISLIFLIVLACSLVIIVPSVSAFSSESKSYGLYNHGDLGTGGIIANDTLTNNYQNFTATIQPSVTWNYSSDYTGGNQGALIISVFQTTSNNGYGFLLQRSSEIGEYSVMAITWYHGVFNVTLNSTTVQNFNSDCRLMITRAGSTIEYFINGELLYSGTATYTESVSGFFLENTISTNSDDIAYGSTLNYSIYGTVISGNNLSLLTISSIIGIVVTIMIIGMVAGIIKKF